MKDRRLFLKVKIKALVAESRIIRQEERKNPHARIELAEHRRGIVRQIARINNLAYGFIRGMEYRKMERNTHTKPDWRKVWKIIENFGVCYDWNGVDVDWVSFVPRKEAQQERFEKWKNVTIETATA